MSTPTVRLADGRDLDAVAALFRTYREFYGVPAAAGECLAFIAERIGRRDSVIFVSEYPADSEPTNSALTVAGFAQVYPTFSSLRAARAWVLNDLYVDAGHRRCGIASSLLRAVRQHAAEQGVATVSLATATSNAAARALYEAHGYTMETAFVTYECEISPSIA